MVPHHIRKTVQVSIPHSVGKQLISAKIKVKVLGDSRRFSTKGLYSTKSISTGF